LFESKGIVMSEFTEQQLADWVKYEEVRKSGKYSMFDIQAQASARLDKDSYFFVMKNFSALSKAVEEKKVKQ
jgi:hypothetical protein